jgi:hypothetical protein
MYLYILVFYCRYKVRIGGNFNSVSGVAKHRVARIKPCTNSSVWNGSVWDNGLHPVIKQLFSMIIWQVLLPMMLVPA